MPKFSNVQTEAGIPFIGKIGQAATWGDYNLDGWPDLFLSNSDRGPRGRKLRRGRSTLEQKQIQRSFLFVNEEGQFKELSSYLGIPNSRYKTATWADYNNDGFPDLLLGTNKAGMPVQLYKNIDGLSFVDVSDQAGITKQGSTAVHGIWADYDNDGNVDLFQVGKGLSFLYRNKGDGTFEEVTEFSRLDNRFLSNSALWFDSNNDGYQDLFLVNKGINKMYLNQRDGTFLDITESSGLDGRVIWDTTSACSGDYNGDGYFDIYVTNIGITSGNALYRNNKDGTFTNITLATNTNDLGDGRTCAWIDFDADGKLDLFSTNHVHPNRLYRNLGNDVFVDVAPMVGIDEPMDVFAATWGDYNKDGFIDVFLNGHLGTGLMKNNGNSNNSVTLNLIGNGLLTNMMAIGARVEIVSGDETQVREVSGGRGCCEQDMLPVYFGIGRNNSIDIKVKWPSGKTCLFEDIKVEKVSHFTIHEL
ncbi:MAG: CRTAC1 family protein, partial [Thermodesulfobacteriales bacterium]